jgi:hypothetical protein
MLLLLYFVRSCYIPILLMFLTVTMFVVVVSLSFTTFWHQICNHPQHTCLCTAFGTSTFIRPQDVAPVMPHVWKQVTWLLLVWLCDQVNYVQVYSATLLQWCFYEQNNAESSLLIEHFEITCKILNTLTWCEILIITLFYYEWIYPLINVSLIRIRFIIKWILKVYKFRICRLCVSFS